VDSRNYSIFSQKLKEFYWTVTRAGLGHLHDGSSNKHQTDFYGCFLSLYAVAARFSVTRVFDSLMRPS